MFTHSKACDFLFDISYAHFLKIVDYKSRRFLTMIPKYPLELNVFSDLSYVLLKNDLRAFFNFFMKYHDNRLVYNE